MFFHTIHILGTLDCIVSVHWAPLEYGPGLWLLSLNMIHFCIKYYFNVHHYKWHAGRSSVEGNLYVIQTDGSLILILKFNISQSDFQDSNLNICIDLISLVVN